MGSCAGGGGGGGFGGRLDAFAEYGSVMESALQAARDVSARRARSRSDEDVARRMGGHLQQCWGLCSVVERRGRPKCCGGPNLRKRTNRDVPFGLPTHEYRREAMSRNSIIRAV